MADTDTDPGCSDEVRRNLQLLLALSPCISGADFKKTYKDQFGLDFDLHGGNLMEALEPYVRLGICTIEKRLVPRGSTLQFIHRAITADGPNFEVGYLLERYDDHTGQIFHETEMNLPNRASLSWKIVLKDICFSQMGN